MSDGIVVGIVGMPGSGKSVAARISEAYGFTTYVMGDVIREQVASRGLDPTPDNIGRIMLKLREENGAAIVAQLCLKKIKKGTNNRIVIEGIRSMDEVGEFHKVLPRFTILSVHSSPKTRFLRIYKRRRSDDTVNRQAFTKRDDRELRVGIGSVIALADHVIVNEGTLDDFTLRVRHFFERILLEHTSDN